MSRRFHTDDRTSENFTKSGLETLTGQPAGKWGRYIVKELFDNSLDYGEETDRTPVITVALKENVSKRVSGGHHPTEEPELRQVTVRDNGPGIQEDELRQIFANVHEFGGTKRHYCLPTRGNQGNALMTILGIQTVIRDGGQPLYIESNGQAYHVNAILESFSDRPEINIQIAGSSDHEQGLSISVGFGDNSIHYASVTRIIETVRQFAALNPQANLRIEANSAEPHTFPARDSPTVNTLGLRGRARGGKVTWFGLDAFENRLKADVRAQSELATADFVREFAGLSSRQKATTILRETADLPEEVATGTIRDLFDADGYMHGDLVGVLYQRMVAETRTYSPGGLNKTLGSVGKDLTAGAHRYVSSASKPDESDLTDLVGRLNADGTDVTADDLTVYYSDADVIEPDSIDGRTIPFHFELTAAPTDARRSRGKCDLVFGINQSVSYAAPKVQLRYKVDGKQKRKQGIASAFRQLGHEFTVICNLTCPNLDFHDKDKQRFTTTPFAGVISTVVGKAVRKMARDVRPKLNALLEPDTDTDTHEESEPPTLDHKAPEGVYKQFVFADFEDAYNWATNEGEFSNIRMRNFFYVMRDRFDAKCEREEWKWTANSSVGKKTPLELKDTYFNKLVAKYEETVLGERIINRDDRGLFAEPHSNRRIPLGTQPVAKYSPNLQQYGTLLFIEKTGFFELLHDDFEIDKRYDVGLIQSKGKGTGAYRDLVEKIKAKAAARDREIPLYTLTDLDIAGIGIAANANEADELSAVNEFGAERIGIDLDTVAEYDLRTESVSYRKRERTELANRHDAGEVSTDLYEFLTEDSGQRVEINALAPVELNDFLESTFEGLGIEKVHPDSPDDVDAPEVKNLDTARENAINRGIGTFVTNQTSGLEADVREQIRAAGGDGDGDDYAETVSNVLEDEVDTTDDENSNIAEQLAEIPTGEEASKEIYDELCGALSDHPPRRWGRINDDIVVDRQEEIDSVVNTFTTKVKTQAQRYMAENYEIEIDITKKEAPADD